THCLSSAVSCRRSCAMAGTSDQLVQHSRAISQHRAGGKASATARSFNPSVPWSGFSPDRPGPVPAVARPCVERATDRPVPAKQEQSKKGELKLDAGWLFILDQLAIGARADRTRRISLRRFALTASLALPKFDEPEGETGRSA